MKTDGLGQRPARAIFGLVQARGKWRDLENRVDKIPGLPAKARFVLVQGTMGSWIGNTDQRPGLAYARFRAAGLAERHDSAMACYSGCKTKSWMLVSPADTVTSTAASL